jgi:hypothetical protein
MMASAGWLEAFGPTPSDVEVLALRHLASTLLLYRYRHQPQLDICVAVGRIVWVCLFD